MEKDTSVPELYSLAVQNTKRLDDYNTRLTKLIQGDHPLEDKERPDSFESLNGVLTEQQENKEHLNELNRILNNLEIQKEEKESKN